MKTKLAFFGIFVLVFFGIIFTVQAANPFALTFPIAELGNCQDYNSCKTYCDDSANLQVCTSFGEKQGLISKQEAQQNRELVQTFSDAPGGCKSEQECKTYCNDPAHLNECVAFGQKHGFISQEDALRIQKVGFAGGPGGCKGEECKAYCDNAAHQEECISFGEQNGLLTKEQADQARKFANQTGPGGCKGEECRRYCDDQSHQTECFQFAKDNGLISPEDAARAEKFMKASEQGGPGGCKGDECRTYCDDVSHREECFKFAKNNGLLSSEDEQQFEVGQKLNDAVMQSGGPGGCKNEDECKAYCSDSSHVEECIAFGSAHAGIPQDQAKQMLQQFTEQKFQAQGQFMRPQEFQQFQQESEQKFQQFRQLEQEFRGPQMQQIMPALPMGQQGQQNGSFQQFQGPGGCTSPSECIKYCSDHSDECFNKSMPQMPQLRPYIMEEFKQQEREDRSQNEMMEPFEREGEDNQGKFPNQMPMNQQNFIPPQEGENDRGQPQNQMMPSQNQQPMQPQQFTPPATEIPSLPPPPSPAPIAPAPTGGSILDAVRHILHF